MVCYLDFMECRKRASSACAQPISSYALIPFTFLTILSCHFDSSFRLQTVPFPIVVPFLFSYCPIPPHMQVHLIFHKFDVSVNSGLQLFLALMTRRGKEV